MLVKSFSELRVWQEGHKLVLDVYKISTEFPNQENFGLTSQIRRAAISITSNIAEGFERKSKKEFSQFLTIARGSLSEVQSQLLVARDLKYIDKPKFDRLAGQSVIVHKLLNGFIRSLKTSSQANQLTSKLKTGGF